MFDKWKDMAEKSYNANKNKLKFDQSNEFLKDLNKKFSKSSEDLIKMKDKLSQKYGNIHDVVEKAHSLYDKVGHTLRQGLYDLILYLWLERSNEQFKPFSKYEEQFRKFINKDFDFRNKTETNRQRYSSFRNLFNNQFIGDSSDFKKMFSSRIGLSKQKIFDQNRRIRERIRNLNYGLSNKFRETYQVGQKKGRRLVYFGLLAIFLYGVGSAIPHATVRYLSNRDQINFQRERLLLEQQSLNKQ